MPRPSIAFILPYPLHRAPSQRFRVEQLLFLLDDAQISYQLYPFMDDRTWNVLYKGGSLWQKAIGILKGYCRRWKTVLWDVRAAETVFIHREAAPLGPPIFEWILTKLLKKKVVFDFDDAIWIPNTSAENRLASSVKAFWKTAKICSWVDIVVGGNDYLCAFARAQHARKVVLIPTVVNTVSRYNRLHAHQEGKKPVVGWTGSHSTLKYLDQLLPIIQSLQAELDFTFVVIADKAPILHLKDAIFVPWNEMTEIEDLLKIDIGVMPLTTDAWSEGKCGFKLIQYLALGIPAIASPIGVNSKIITEGQNGLLCSTEQDWKQALKVLLMEVAKRQSFGQHGRQSIVDHYSVQSQRASFLALFN